MSLKEEALHYHARAGGKIQVVSKVPVRTAADLALAYTPGVAEPCRVIAEDPEAVFRYTNRGNTVAIVTDGSAVLGLGNIGPKAALPVMEGKAVLFKLFGGVDAVPVCLDTQDPAAIVETVRRLEPSIGGVNLEDVAAPRAFEVEARLEEALDVPVFNDDQHGTAIVVGAALLNAVRLTDKRDPSVVINGAGTAGLATARLLRALGFARLTLVDRAGILYAGRQEGMNAYKAAVAEWTNPEGRRGDLRAALEGADVFIGLSTAGALDPAVIRAMRPDPIVLALANPTPEIWPDDARAQGAAVVGTGRSDFPNQINNVLGFPGVFRGALDTRARRVTEGMKLAAARALAGLVAEGDLSADYILPSPLDPRVAPAVAAAVAGAAVADGVARVAVAPEAVAERCRQLVAAYRTLMEAMAAPG